MQNDFNGGVLSKTMWSSSLNDGNAFKQSDPNMSFRNIKYEIVIEWPKAPDHVMYLPTNTVMRVFVRMFLNSTPQ